MNDITAHLRTLLVRELHAFEREIEMFPDDACVWKTVPGVTNSAGNLALHVCGNLQHFVGRVLGGSSYIRNRDVEFNRRSGSRAELVEEIHTTVSVVETVVPALDDDTLSRVYPDAPGGLEITTSLFLLHLSAHLAHHLGQAGYLRRIVTGDTLSAGPLGLKVLGETPPDRESRRRS
jgi:uncharacterized damage-inducible protein DinB